jgi:peptidoglycan/xylan/chitin deacetylase (PgdA/CDA1 family)
MASHDCAGCVHWRSFGGGIMKRRLFPFVAALLISGCPANSRAVAPLYEVGAWQGFRSAAVSFTFDDGCPNQFSIAVPMFNEFGFPLTLFTVTDSHWRWPVEWTRLRNAAANGHEVASHTVTHANFSGLSDSLQTIEFRYSQEEINTHIPGRQCITLAYPFCVPGNRAVVAQYYIAARICSGLIESSTPSDFMNISSITCGTEGPVKTAQDFVNTVGPAVDSKGWCVLMLHGLDNDGSWSPFSSDALRKCLEYLRANPDKFWVSTFGSVVRYIEERNSVSVSEKAVTATGLTVLVTDTLDNAVFNVPITLRRRLPDGWMFATVTQNRSPAPSRLVRIDDVSYVQFDVVPDGGDVVIEKRNSAE